MPSRTWLSSLLRHGANAGLNGRTIYLIILAFLGAGLMGVGGRPWLEAMGFIVICYLIPPVHDAYEVRRRRNEKRADIRSERDQNSAMIEKHRKRVRSRQPELPFEPPGSQGAAGPDRSGDHR